MGKNMSFKPDHLPTLIPYLSVRNAQDAINFYQKAFGFELTSSSKDESGEPAHAEMKRGDAVIMFAGEGKFGSAGQAPITLGVRPSTNIYVYCEDVDALYKQAIQAGAKSLMEPNDAFWGDRMCCVVDLDGYEWSFGTYLNK